MDWNPGNLEGLVPIIGGIFALLLATGKMAASKNPQKNEEWRQRFGPMLKIISPLVILFGLARLSGILE